MEKGHSSYLGLKASPACRLSLLLTLTLRSTIINFFLKLLGRAGMTSLSQFAQNCPGFKTKILTSQEFGLGPRQTRTVCHCRSLELNKDLCTTRPASLCFQKLLFSPLFFLTFILLAILLGKHQPGVDKPDPKTWKANFRCAMNSLPDIEEVKDKSIKKGNNAFRVYRMLPLSERPSKKGRYLLTKTMGM